MGRKSRDDKPTEPNGEKPALTPEDAKAVMEQAVAEALKSNPDSKLPEMMRELFNAVIDQAKAKADAAAPPAAPPTAVDTANVVNLDAERQKREGAKATEDAIQAGMRDAVSSYMTENFAKEAKEVTVDPTFLKDHGPGLFAALLSGFAQAIVPEEIKVDVPTENGDQKKMTLKVDFSSLFKNLGKRPGQGPTTNEPPKDPEES